MQEIGQLAPFAVLSATADFCGPCFQPAEGRNLRFQFFNSSRGCRLVEELLLSQFDIRVGRIFQIFHVILVKNGTSKSGRIPMLPRCNISNSRRRRWRRSLRLRKD